MKPYFHMCIRAKIHRDQGSQGCQCSEINQRRFKKDVGTDRGIYMYGDVTKLIDLTSTGVPVQAETPPPKCFGYGDSTPNQILNTNLETNAENGTV